MICESQYRQTADSSLLQIYFDAQFWTVQTFEKFTRWKIYFLISQLPESEDFDPSLCGD